MKLSSIIPIIAASTSVAAAKSLLTVFPSEVTVGETYNVEWLSDAKEVRSNAIFHVSGQPV